MGRLNHERNLRLRYPPIFIEMWTDETEEWREEMDGIAIFKGLSGTQLLWMWWLNKWMMDYGGLDYERIEGVDCYGQSRYGKIKYREVLKGKKKRR